MLSLCRRLRDSIDRRLAIRVHPSRRNSALLKTSCWGLRWRVIPTRNAVPFSSDYSRLRRRPASGFAQLLISCLRGRYREVHVRCEFNNEIGCTVSVRHRQADTGAPLVGLLPPGGYPRPYSTTVFPISEPAVAGIQLHAVIGGNTWDRNGIGGSVENSGPGSVDWSGHLRIGTWRRREIAAGRPCYQDAR